MTTLSKQQIPSIAVIGAGYWGKNLVRNFHQLGSLKLIYDKSETVLRSLKEQYGDIDTCISLSHVLERKDIEGVVISTPAETHFYVAREALLAGKHVFVEKPLVLNETEGLELINIAKETNRVLMVGHLLQYHPVFIKLKNMVMSGELGRVHYIYSNRLNFGKIRREENILWSFAPHDISMILSLSGEVPESIMTTGGYYLHQRIADVTTTHFEFASGLHAHIFVSWLHPFKEQKLVVVGEQKMAVFDDTRPWPEKLLVYPHHVQWVNGLPVSEKAEPERIDIVPDEPLRRECMHFLDCISTGQHPTTDGEEGLRVLQILNASQHSLDKHGQKVNLAGELISKEPQSLTNSKDESPSQTIEADVYIHDTAIVDRGVSIGSGTKIWQFSHVLTGSTLGKRCNIGQNVVIGPDVQIGEKCKIQNNVSVYKGVTLEDGAFCGPSMVFTNIINPRAEISKMNQVLPTLVKKGATIGANATIVCGTTLGRYSFVGAGAVVTRDVPDHALVVGNPAKVIGWACECGERLSADLECAICGKKYLQTKEGITPAKIG
ncbi:oxidoreductase [Desulfopila sp. IMCC35006]|uniref:Gfo/Idh/MocA family oxidoreductase n=1 Tax=Desulfopila sp. IMCC35006 TaxID=2569542 RepID=UPI0010ACAF38|nr:Gfo/Idh/MocA family oxidoreductase [Desulfopila sp. IMCC35006]TKB23969.1 oxidoreductase [Desulfopila sp. IMCC35006]